MLSGKLPDELKTLDNMKKCVTPFDEIADHQWQEQPNETAPPFVPKGDPPPQELPQFYPQQHNEEALVALHTQGMLPMEQPQKAKRYSIAGYPSAICSTPLSSKRNKCNETFDSTSSPVGQTETLSPIDSISLFLSYSLSFI